MAPSRRLSHSARPLARIAHREVGVNDAPLPVLLVEHYRRAADEVLALVVDVAWRRGPRPDPVALRMAVAPDHGHVALDLAADVEGRPVRALHVLDIERPQPAPMFRAGVGVTVELEERRV